MPFGWHESLDDFRDTFWLLNEKGSRTPTRNCRLIESENEHRPWLSTSTMNTVTNRSLPQPVNGDFKTKRPGTCASQASCFLGLFGHGCRQVLQELPDFAMCAFGLLDD
jgi:hypothetical protein